MLIPHDIELAAERLIVPALANYFRTDGALQYVQALQSMAAPGTLGGAHLDREVARLMKLRRDLLDIIIVGHKHGDE